MTAHQQIRQSKHHHAISAQPSARTNNTRHSNEILKRYIIAFSFRRLLLPKSTTFRLHCIIPISRPNVAHRHRLEPSEHTVPRCTYTPLALGCAGSGATPLSSYPPWLSDATLRRRGASPEKKSSRQAPCWVSASGTCAFVSSSHPPFTRPNPAEVPQPNAAGNKQTAPGKKVFTFSPSPASSSDSASSPLIPQIHRFLLHIYYSCEHTVSLSRTTIYTFLLLHLIHCAGLLLAASYHHPRTQTQI